MATETVSFRIDPYDAMRLILKAYMETDLNWFNHHLIKQKDTEYFYHLPEGLSSFIYSYVDKVSDETLDRVAGNTFSESYNVGYDKEETRQLFIALLLDDAFTTHLKQKGHLLLKYGVYDRHDDALYQSSFGEHAKTIMEIVNKHSELTTDKDRDAYIMTHLDLFGNARPTPNDYYEKDLVGFFREDGLRPVDVKETLRSFLEDMTTTVNADNQDQYQYRLMIESDEYSDYSDIETYMAKTPEELLLYLLKTDTLFQFEHYNHHSDTFLRQFPDLFEKAMDFAKEGDASIYSFTIEVDDSNRHMINFPVVTIKNKNKP